jgi:hypothetical protein
MKKVFVVPMYEKQEYRVLVSAEDFDQAAELASENFELAKVVPGSKEIYPDKSCIYEAEFSNTMLSEDDVAFNILGQDDILYLTPDSERSLEDYPILNSLYDDCDPEHTCGASEHIVNLITMYIEEEPSKLKEAIKEIAKIARYSEVELR